MKRRVALNISLTVVFFLACMNVVKPTAAATFSLAQAFVTDAAGHRVVQVDATPPGNAAADATFTFNTTTPRQSILGFGGAFTEGACTVLDRLAPADRAALLDEFYNPTQSNFSIGRLCVGASDYSTQLYSYDDGDADPTLSRFSVDHDRVAVLPVLQQARKIRPDLFLFASPWSPPGWMKYGGSMCGGSIKPRLLNVYAQYIVRYLQAYRDAGIPINAMTIQNEIDADQDAKMPACAWPAETEAKYVVKFLGPQLIKSGLHTPIWMLDHNYDLAGRVLDQLDKPDVRAHISAIAWHGYEGDPASMKLVHDHYPDLPAQWTEGGDESNSPKLDTAWARWAGTFAEILNDGASSITTWNLALDENGRPNLGPFHCVGLVTIDSKTRAITRNGIYWALVHFAKAMPRGSRVLVANPIKSGAVSAVAAKRPDGSIAVVVSNAGPATRVGLTVDGRPHVLNASADSVTTIELP